MGKESGKNVIVKVGDGAGTEVFTALSGQSSAKLNMSANPVDVTDKTTGGWGATIAGTIGASVSVSGYPNWPDTNGWQKLREAFEAQETINCRLILNSAGAYYQGPFSVTGFSVDGEANGATKYDITLQAADALAYNSSGG